MELKHTLHALCKDELNKRLKIIKGAINEVEDALLSETKSSAGDKHETGRAMLQLEREKLGQQLMDVQSQIQILQRINSSITQTTIALGSIVFTSQLNYFIAVGAGKISCQNQDFYAVSATSPIGKELIGHKVLDEILFRSQQISITKVI